MWLFDSNQHLAAGGHCRPCWFDLIYQNLIDLNQMDCSCHIQLTNDFLNKPLRLHQNVCSNPCDQHMLIPSTRSLHSNLSWATMMQQCMKLQQSLHLTEPVVKLDSWFHWFVAAISPPEHCMLQQWMVDCMESWSLQQSLHCTDAQHGKKLLCFQSQTDIKNMSHIAGIAEKAE